MKKTILFLMFYGVLFSQNRETQTSFENNRNNSSTPMKLIPRIRDNYEPLIVNFDRSNLDSWCGTNSNSERGCTINGETDYPEIRDSFIPNELTDTLLIRLYFHAFADDNGNNPTFSLMDAEAQLQTLNEAFAPHKIKFDALYQTHNDSQYQFITQDDWNAGVFKELYGADPLIYHNFYVTDTHDDWGILGVSNFPWYDISLTDLGGTIVDKDWFGGPRYFNGNSDIPQHTATHELGHALGLYHTHRGDYEVTTCGNCYEGAEDYVFVDGDNADNTGDFCSDTKGTTVNFTCGDPGTDDCQGNPFVNTDFHNFMGYADDDCYNLNNEGFSSQQSGRMHGWAMDRYDGLIVDSENKTIFNASFENGIPSDWTIIDNDGDGYQWTSYFDSEGYDNSYYGNAGLSSFYNSNGNDDWIISPQVNVSMEYGELNFNFWAHSYHNSYLEDINIKVSTSGNSVDDFTHSILSIQDIPVDWTNYNIDLSEFIGQDIYIAIQHVSIDHWYIMVDDIVLTAESYNLAPIATALEFTTDEDTEYVGSFIASDIDEEMLTYSVETLPTNGEVTISENTFTYTPNLNFNGEDSFTYSVSDGILSDEASVTITVNSINDAPVAMDQEIETNEDVEYSGTLDGNDVDSYDLIYSIVTQTTNGTITLDDASNGTYTYTPNAEYNGEDSFTYSVSDGEFSGNGNVSIIINAQNDSPIATALEFSTDEDTEHEGNFVASDIDEDALTYSVETFSTNGEVTISENTFTYMPHLNFNGEDSFTYSVSDGFLSDIASVTITVNGINDAPVAVDQEIETNEDVEYSGTLDGSDVDSSDLTYSIVTQTTNGTITLDDASNGTYTYTPNAEYNGEDSFTYSVSDGEYSDNGSVSIIVNAQNDSPIATALEFTTDEDTEYVGSFIASDIDEEMLTYSVETLPTNGEVTVSENTFTYTPNLNFNGEDSFVYSVSDGILSDEASVTITVNSINDAPVAMDQEIETNEDVEYSGTLDGNDVDSSDLTFSIITQPTNGLLTLDDTSIGTYTYTPNAEYNGEDSFTYSVSDGEFSDNGSVSIIINAVNDLPTSFLLLEPENNSTLFLTNDNIETDSIHFIWETSTDIEDDVNYLLNIKYNIFDNNELINTYDFELFIENPNYTIQFSSIYEEMQYVAGYNLQINWDVSSIAGQDTLNAENNPFELIIDGTALKLDEVNIPKEFKLYPNYPNPFNPITNIRYEIPNNLFLTLMVYDIKGRLVSKLFEGYQKSGFYELNWNASNMKSGVYFVKMISGDSSINSEKGFIQSQKVVLMK